MRYLISSTMIIKGEKIYLKKGLSDKDYSKLLKWYQDIEIMKYISFVKRALKLKTVNEIKKHNFIEIKTLENIQREMIVSEQGTRPSFDMLGHTGYLTFARKVLQKGFLEKKGKIKVREVGTLNPLFIDILDQTIEKKVVNNPIVDVDEVE